MINTIKSHWFLSAMIGAILLASISADIGCNHGTMHLDKLTAIGVGIVFFLHGLGLSPKAIKSGVSHWRMHLFIQLTTFVVYPLIWLLLGDLLQVYMPSALAIGFCYLLLLPSTVSSSVAMTSLGRGNVPGAVFNASLSMLLGVFLTPLLVQLIIGFSSATLDFMSAIIALSQQLLLPIITGQLLRPILLSTLKKHQSWVNNIDKYVILLIVYNAFCNAIINDIWHAFTPNMLIFSIIICLFLLLFMVKLVRWAARRCQFLLADEVTIVFCGTKKTLVAGIPMATAIFGNDPHLSMILLPVMLYHPMQIFYCAVLANRYAKRIDGINDTSAIIKS